MTRKIKIRVVAGMITAIVLAVVIPAGLAHWQATVERAECASTLLSIDAAKNQWALGDVQGSKRDPTWADIFPYGGRGSASEWSYNEWYSHYPPHCPEGGSYTLGDRQHLPKCSILGHDLSAFGITVTDEQGNPIDNANIEMTGKHWKRFKVKTHADGEAIDYYEDPHDSDSRVTLKWPLEPISATISKDGYFTQSQTIEMIWGTNYGTILLKKKPK